MGNQVLNTIRACNLCQSNDKTAKSCPGPLQPVLLPDGLWQKVAIDIVGLFEAASLNYRFIITVIDYCSKWPEVVFVKDTTTGTALTFMLTVFHGNLLSLVTDNGVQFTSTSFTSF